MTRKERHEREVLHRKWATGKASMREMDRCMELDRQARWEAQEAERLDPVEVACGR